MNTTQRRYEIYEKLKKDKTVQVNELAKVYAVSLMTIRRDLDMLENQGLATKSYGGATLNESSSSEPSFEIKEGISQSDKKEIAIYASSLIQDGDSIYLDCGTTCLELFKRIHHKKITIFTNFWKILQYVDRNTKAKIIMAPGTYNPITQAAAIMNPNPENLSALFSIGLTVKSFKFISSVIVYFPVDFNASIISFVFWSSSPLIR